MDKKQDIWSSPGDPMRVRLRRLVLREVSDKLCAADQHLAGRYRSLLNVNTDISDALFKRSTDHLNHSHRERDTQSGYRKTYAPSPHHRSRKLRPHTAVGASLPSRHRHGRSKSPMDGMDSHHARRGGSSKPRPKTAPHPRIISINKHPFGKDGHRQTSMCLMRSKPPVHHQQSTDIVDSSPLHDDSSRAETPQDINSRRESLTDGDSVTNGRVSPHRRTSLTDRDHSRLRRRMSRRGSLIDKVSSSRGEGKLAWGADTSPVGSARYDRLYKKNALDKFRRIAWRVTLMMGICSTMKRLAESRVNDERSLVEMILNIKSEFNDVVAFDLETYNLNSEIRGGDRLKEMLAIPPAQRFKHHVFTIMALIQKNDFFQDYPRHIQLELCQCIYYQRLEPGRVIIRQGHPPSAFYIILTGTVLVNLRETDRKTGQTFSITVDELSSGEAFGEIAIINNTLRTTTVTTKDDVELLVVSKLDFDRIVKDPLMKLKEKQIEYCRNLEIFKEFPCEKLQSHAAHFYYQYFKKDKLVTGNSKHSDILVIVKSGTCLVVSEIREVVKKPRVKSAKQKELESNFPLITDQVKRGHEPQSVFPTDIKHGRPGEDGFLVLDKSEKWMKTVTKVGNQLGVWATRLVTPVGVSQKDEDKEEEERKASVLSAAQAWKRHHEAKKKERENIRISYATLTKLGAGSIFGLESMFLESIPNMKLISEGAECIFISKSFFLREANSKVIRILSDIVTNYPTEEFIKDQITKEREWVKYKKQLVKDVHVYLGKKHIKVP